VLLRCVFTLDRDEFLAMLGAFNEVKLRAHIELGVDKFFKDLANQDGVSPAPWCRAFVHVGLRSRGHTFSRLALDALQGDGDGLGPS
jgi:hypothetical protein